MQTIFVGTSGFNYSSWKEAFYPRDMQAKDFLSYYSSQFSTVEINATFYKHFDKEIFSHWRKQTTDDFLFTIKGPKMITHMKKLVNVDEDLQIFSESVSGLQEKLRTVLWQFPGSFTNTELNRDKLVHFFTILPSISNHVIELRNATWFTNSVYRLCKEYAVGFVINDTSAFPTTIAVTTATMYIRFHGPGKLYASAYELTDLKKWAKIINQYKADHTVYCYFNNDMSGYAIRNARSLISLV